MLFRESETIELKEVIVDDIKGEIVAVDIQRGTDHPYYLAKKGCVLRAYMSGKAILLFPPLTRRFAV